MLCTLRCAEVDPSRCQETAWRHQALVQVLRNVPGLNETRVVGASHWPEQLPGPTRRPQLEGACRRWRRLAQAALPSKLDMRFMDNDEMDDAVVVAAQIERALCGRVCEELRLPVNPLGSCALPGVHCLEGLHPPAQVRWVVSMNMHQYICLLAACRKLCASTQASRALDG